MEKSEIIAGNEAIAKFMGATWYENITAKDKFHPEKLKYHIDWQWIMPVVKKISLHTDGKKFSLWADILQSLHRVEIEETWKAIVKYLNPHQHGT